MNALAYERDDDLLVVNEPYFPSGSPLRYDDGTTYASDTVLEEHATHYEWPHSLAEIFSAVIGGGLNILAFDEHRTIPWKALSSLTPSSDGFVLPSGRDRLPLMFSLTARRPS